MPAARGPCHNPRASNDGLFVVGGKLPSGEKGRLAALRSDALQAPSGGCIGSHRARVPLLWLKLCLQRDEQAIGFIALQPERVLRKGGGVLTSGEQINAAITHDEKGMLA
ncbi:MAG: hypothetical protein JO125_12955 [Chloroflexi bacterium]|nr:hypothetical protein [Chloroflexota bacterium]